MGNDANNLLIIIARENERANKLVTSQLVEAIKACESCGSAVDQYIKLEIPSAKIVELIDAAGVPTVAGTGIGCPACIDMGQYVKSILEQNKIEQQKIEREYCKQ